MSKRKRLENMIDRHHPAIYRHALWLSGDRETASDLVQETYYEAWKSLRRSGAPRRELPWLLTILRRQAARAYATKSREAPVREPDAVECLAGPERSDNEVLDLVRGLYALSMRQRDLLLLYALHGFSYQQIAAELDVPLGTVMSRLSRARRDLERHMGRDQDAASNIVPMPVRGAKETET